jgi:hypothetical protein
MSKRRFAHLLAAVVLILAAAAAEPARAEPDNSIPTTVSDRIVAQLSRADLDAVARELAKYMGQDVADRIKNNFASIKDLGKPQYTELVYSRDYGKTGRDFIYKIDFDKAFAYVRLLWNVDNSDWRLTHLGYKTESELPFPSGWEHIYPK